LSSRAARAQASQAVQGETAWSRRKSTRASHPGAAAAASGTSPEGRAPALPSAKARQKMRAAVSLLPPARGLQESTSVMSRFIEGRGYRDGMPGFAGRQAGISLKGEASDYIGMKPLRTAFAREAPQTAAHPADAVGVQKQYRRAEAAALLEHFGLGAVRHHAGQYNHDIRIPYFADQAGFLPTEHFQGYSEFFGRLYVFTPQPVQSAHKCRAHGRSPQRGEAPAILNNKNDKNSNILLGGATEILISYKHICTVALFRK
jgi:hypothetical protein